MAYFNHAFVKCFNPTALAAGTTKTIDLTPGEFGLVTDASWTVATPGNGELGYIVQGSYHTRDSIGNNPGHGGYTESVKSKGINPRYITRLYSTECISATQSTASISVDSDCAPCGEPLYLRLDVKGSPALRFLNRNAYAIVDSSSACCADGQEYVDPVIALAEAAKNLLADPIVAPFIQATAGSEIVATVAGVSTSYTIEQALDGTYTPSTDPITDQVTAQFNLEGAYVETKFGNCTFDPRDFYGKEPVQLTISLLDETGDPCNTCGVATSTPGTMASTIGETVLRDIIMTESYMQSPYNQGNVDSARIREIEGSDDILASVDRSGLYKTYVIQHSVPRFNNPTGVFDNDQYLYKIYVKCTDTALIANMDTLFGTIATWAASNGNNVPFQQHID